MGERRFISAKAITQALGSTTMMAALRNQEPRSIASSAKASRATCHGSSVAHSTCGSRQIAHFARIGASGAGRIA
jgi:hypothetical protein